MLYEKNYTIEVRSRSNGRERVDCFIHHVSVINILQNYVRADGKLTKSLELIKVDRWSNREYGFLSDVVSFYKTDKRSYTVICERLER